MSGAGGGGMWYFNTGIWGAGGWTLGVLGECGED